MQKFPFPLQIPAGRTLTITQPFGVTPEVLEPVGPNGEPHFHYGVDVVDGDATETYGTPIVCPFNGAKLESYQFAGAVTPATNFLKLSAYGASGNHYAIILAHVCAVMFRSEYNAGEVVALVGNNGLVWPAPTPAAPLSGAHLHFGVQMNGKWVDPLQFFDVTAPFYGPEHSPNVAIPRFMWSLEILQAEFNKLIAAKQQ